MRGVFILLEGLDRCGKTTQTKLLFENLKGSGYRVQLINFPDRTSPTGQLINSYLKKDANLPDEAIHLLFSVNRWEKVEEMKQLLNDGVNLVVDRYSYSGVAYSVAKESGLTYDWCKAPEVGLPKPDVVFYLNIPVEAIGARKEFGSERYDKKDFLERVDKSFKNLKDDNWIILNADDTPENISNTILLHSKQVIEKAKLMPLQILW